MEEPTQNPSIAEWLALMEACRPREVLPCLAGPIGQAAEGHVMPGVYPELRGFVFAHRKCAGRRRADDPLDGAVELVEGVEVGALFTVGLEQPNHLSDVAPVRHGPQGLPHLEGLDHRGARTDALRDHRPEAVKAS